MTVFIKCDKTIIVKDNGLLRFMVQKASVNHDFIN